MDATLIVIDNDVELARALALVDQLMRSGRGHRYRPPRSPGAFIAAHEESKWPRRVPSTAAVI
jgi:hypothetical protein